MICLVAEKTVGKDRNHELEVWHQFFMFTFRCDECNYWKLL